MSKIFKKPKSFLKQGSIEARNIKSAKLILNQEHLDHILSQVSPEIGAGWLKYYGKHLKFVPRQLQVEPVQLGQD